MIALPVSGYILLCLLAVCSVVEWLAILGMQASIRSHERRIHKLETDARKMH